MKLPISVIIITLNEEKNIRDCLESIKDWVDEIFLVDSGSTDRTLEIAKDYTDKICFHRFENFYQQSNWAQDSLPIKNDWVMHLDADERVSVILAKELKDEFNAGVNVDGFMVPRKTIFRGKWIRFGGHYPVFHLRIFKKSKGRCEERLYDQHFIVTGAVRRLDGDIVNIINEDLNSWMERHKKWAALEAREVLSGRDRKTGTSINAVFAGRRWLRNEVYYRMPLFIRPFIYFFYRYILRLGFLDGNEGTFFHFWQGLWYRLLVDKEIYKLSKVK